ncbi:MAG: PAS domain S-box protein [Bacteroidota bacterium]
MTQNDTNPDSQYLRQQAEERLKEKSSNAIARFSEVETQKLIAELEVRQIELELQKVELRHAWAMAEVASDKFTKLYNFSPTGYFSLSKEGSITELNHSAAQLLGTERFHLKGAQFSFFVSDDTRPVFIHFLDAVCKSRAKETCELTLLTQANPAVFVQLTGIAVTSGEDCLVSLIDITERKRLESALRDSEEKYSKAFQTSFYAIAISSLEDGTYFDVNDAFSTYTGFSRAEVINNSSSELNLWVDAEDRKRLLSALQEGKEVKGKEVKIRRKNGEVITTLFSAEIISLNNVPFLLSSIFDISDRKRAE